MFIKTFLVSTLLAASALASVHNLPSRCSQEPDDEQKEEARILAIQEDKDHDEGCPKFRNNIVIDTYFHIVAEGQTAAEGNVPQSQVQDQLEVLNNNYRQAGVSFRLKKTTRTINKKWSHSLPTSANSLEMRKALREGDYKTLNIYFQQSLGSGNLGYCQFPKKDVEPGSFRFYDDGCRVAVHSMPGGTLNHYNQGKTATHEVGHWLNLFHTFQGDSCSGPGDHVRDTPQERSANTGGCSRPRNTCPGQGPDPIHNFMDYSYDPCMNDFTEGQTRRIHASWKKYRADS